MLLLLLLLMLLLLNEMRIVIQMVVMMMMMYIEIILFGNQMIQLVGCLSPHLGWDRLKVQSYFTGLDRFNQEMRFNDSIDSTQDINGIARYSTDLGNKS